MHKPISCAILLTDSRNRYSHSQGDNMENLIKLLIDLECISLADISAIPEYNQHTIAENLEQLQDVLRELLLDQSEMRFNNY